MKLTILIDKELPLGLIANTAAALGVSIGHIAGEIVGRDLRDADGGQHRGITAKNIPVLGAAGEKIRDIRDRVTTDGAFADTVVVGFSSLAQRCLDYDQYAELLAATQTGDIDYFGICLYGPEKQVNKLTGSIALLR